MSKGFGALSHSTVELGGMGVLCVGRAEGRGMERWVWCYRKHFLIEVSKFLVS